MFREGDRLPIVRRAILAAPLATPGRGPAPTREESIAARRLRPRSASSNGSSRRFRGLLTRWTVAGRDQFLDPPLHEFLPNPRNSSRR
jgi:hypothetical protein